MSNGALLKREQCGCLKCSVSTTVNEALMVFMFYQMEDARRGGWFPGWEGLAIILPAFFVILLLWLSWSVGRVQPIIRSAVLTVHWSLAHSCEVEESNLKVTDEVRMDSMLLGKTVWSKRWAHEGGLKDSRARKGWNRQEQRQNKIVTLSTQSS